MWKFVNLVVWGGLADRVDKLVGPQRVEVVGQGSVLQPWGMARGTGGGGCKVMQVVGGRRALGGGRLQLESLGLVST